MPHLLTGRHERRRRELIGRGEDLLLQGGVRDGHVHVRRGQGVLLPHGSHGRQRARGRCRLSVRPVRPIRSGHIAHRSTTTSSSSSSSCCPAASREIRDTRRGRSPPAARCSWTIGGGRSGGQPRRGLDEVAGGSLRRGAVRQRR